MKEADFQTKFNKWLKHKHQKTGAFELKLTKEKSLPFSAVAPHQKAALHMAHRGKLIYKIPDESYSQKPFDCFMMEEVDAYVVVMFYKRGQKKFYMIPIVNWITEEFSSTRKSITEEDAQRIGRVCELA